MYITFLFISLKVANKGKFDIGLGKEPLGWSARQKVAVGAARGLRYLHEECRVGCIVHRDMRPNNILLTHDFEPLVLLLFCSISLSALLSVCKV